MEENISRIVESYSDEEFLTADGFDKAIIGVSGDRIVYSRTKCIRILMFQDELSEIDAIEHFDYNVSGAYVGDKTPIWVDDTMFY